MRIDIYGGRYYLFISRYVLSFFLISLEKYGGQKLNNPMCQRTAGELMSKYFFTDILIWLMFWFLTSDNRLAFKWNVDTYGNISHICLLKLCVWLIFCFIYSDDQRARSWVSSKIYILFLLLRSNPYTSNMYIMDQNSRLPSHMICVTNLGYIYILFVCGNFPIILKMRGCCNML